MKEKEFIAWINEEEFIEKWGRDIVKYERAGFESDLKSVISEAVGEAIEIAEYFRDWRFTLDIQKQLEYDEYRGKLEAIKGG